jgi:Ran GTPase-activating protein (RanGAP) involved in mRNA processing and transport
LVELKILWEKVQSIQCSDRGKRALYNCYFYSTIDLSYNSIATEGAKYVAEALKVNTSLTEINLSGNNIGAEGKHSLREAWKHSDGLRV